MNQLIVLFWDAVVNLLPIIFIVAMFLSYPVHCFIEEWNLYQYKKRGWL